MATLLFDPPTAVSTITSVQTAHGYSVGQGIRANGATTVLAQANLAANCGAFLGIVTEVIDVDTFKYALPGTIIGPAGTYTAGQTYYLSDVTPGLVTTTDPNVGSIYLPVGQATPEGSLITSTYNGFDVVSTTGSIVMTNTMEVTTALPHGFLAGEALRATLTGYEKAQADSDANSAALVGIVSEVIAPTMFRIALPGSQFGTSFTGGTVYYLSAATAGALTPVQPTTPNYVVPVGVGLPSGALLLVQYIGVQA